MILNGVQARERDRRSGTRNVPGIVAAAWRSTKPPADGSEPSARVSALRDRLIDGLMSSIDGRSRRRPVEASTPARPVCIAGVEGEALLYLLDRGGVMASEWVLGGATAA